MPSSLARRLAPAAVIVALALVGCGSSGPAVGKCTNSDPKLGVELDVKIVDCGDSSATTKIVKEAKSGAECDSGQLKTSDKKIFCTEPLK
jgi:hypothetical protein